MVEFQAEMSETFYVCRDCGNDHRGDIKWIREFKPIVTRSGDTTYWDCPYCGRNMLVSIDGGTLDLGLVRDA